MTHTFVEFEISRAAYDEIAVKLRRAGYYHAFVRPSDSRQRDAAIDMHGIAVIPAGVPDPAQTVRVALEEAHAMISKRAALDAAEDAITDLDRQLIESEQKEFREVLELLEAAQREIAT